MAQDAKVRSRNVLKGMRYQKPTIKKEKVMRFPFEMINGLGTKFVCRQCSSCHGCR